MSANNLDLNLLLGLSEKLFPLPDISKLNQFNPPLRQLPKISGLKKAGIIASSYFGDMFGKTISDKLGGGEIGGIVGGALGTGTGTVLKNAFTGSTLTNGLYLDIGSSLSGAVTGLASNYVGLGLSSLMGNSRLGQSLGAGVSTIGGTLGGTLTSNLINTGSFGNLSSINPLGLAGNTVGAMLSAATGPSKEYNGKYGNITKTMDSAYGILQGTTNFIPGAGWGISTAMALNKGLSNIFGSTDGMTKTDAILGSAFMPAPVKWLNMIGASKTGTFDKLSWQNTEKINSFMGNAFGNLSDRLDTAREESGKTYGTFSQGARQEALRNINFANQAWDKLLAMVDLNELQKIRSLYMSSINNLRYAQNILGGFSQLARGKQGMKILNNATNHNIGLRLLSGAALIDNKQMILCSVVD